MKVNLLSPDIYEIEDFVSIQEQEEVLNYCKTLDEAEWWKSYDEEYEKGFFFGKQKIGELPSVFYQISDKVKTLFDLACIIEDEPIKDSSDFSLRLQKMLA